MNMRHLNLINAAAGATRAVLIAVAFVAACLTALIPVVANPRTGPREIVLVARDMAFYLEGSTAPNPTIVVKASEEVRVIVKNQNPGITHAFAVGSLRASIDRIEPGSTQGIQFRAPKKPGRYEYVCPPHALMMKGLLLVEK
jgi:heme/copper-type cytochrome/quinol oxidase subunit 2